MHCSAMKLYPVAICLFLFACAEGSSSVHEDDPSLEASDEADDDRDAGRAGKTDGVVVLGYDASRPASASSRDGSTTQPSTPGTKDAGAASAASDAGTLVDTTIPPSDALTTDPALVQALPWTGVAVGYYPAWATYDRDFQVAEIAAGKLTHVNYAFANVQGGRCVLGDAWADVQKTFVGDTWDESSANAAGNFKQLRTLKQTFPKLRTLISVGGWTWSSAFSDVSVSDATRRAFASSCVDFMVAHGFDGIDIDWEYPVGGGLAGNVNRPEDEGNYTRLLKALRSEMTARQVSLKRADAFLLTIAAPAGPSIIEHLEAKAISDVVDWINVMSYDFHGSWERTTGHDAPLYQATGDTLAGFNVETAVDTYLSAGVPPARLVMGVPFYGRSFAGVAAGTTHGLHQAQTGAGPGTWEQGILDYRDIAEHYLSNAGFVRYVDVSASVPYLYNAKTSVFISYDDPESIRAKRALITKKKLAGGMIWDLSSDSADHALLNALVGP